MMPSLADVQSAFIDALKQPEAPVPDAVERKSSEPAKRRFDVYRNNVAVGMIEALRATYPAVDKLVGGDFFAASAKVYLDRHPPHSPLLFRYGDTFGDFLETFPPAASTPYLGDVARLEWARLQAYHARDCASLSIGALGGFLKDKSGSDIDAGKLRFTLHPSLELISSRWPVVSLWAASTGQGSSEDVDMAVPEHALIVRPSLTVETSRLAEGSFAFMSALAGNATLEQAAVSATNAAGDFDLTTHLQGLFAIGAVSAINNNSS
ncbi:MAG: HvfC/BufC N-terminal domain-containing protein [Geminicoccaceae bacterium]